MKRLGKAILKVAIFVALIFVVNFILDLILGLANWIAPALLILAIIGLIATYYYFDDKDNK